MGRVDLDQSIFWAQHEAGHVVVAFALNIGLVRASIDPGLTVCDDDFKTLRAMPENRHVAVRAALFSVAGKVYEQMVMGLYDGDDSAFPDPRPPAWLRSAHVDDVPDDFVLAYENADIIAGRDGARRALSLLMTRAVRLLRRNQRAVAALTSALHERKVMTGDELRRVWLDAGGQAESLPEYIDDVLCQIDTPSGP